MFGSMGQTNVKNLGNGGTMDGDVTITGDLTVSGGISLSLNEVLQGTSTIDINSTEALLVRKDGDGGDVFIVDTTNQQVGVNLSDPAVSLHVVDTNNPADGTLRVGSGIAYSEFKSNASGTGKLIINNYSASGTAHGILFQSNGSTNMTLTSGGSLGIGTTPSEALHISSSEASATPIILIENTNANNLPGQINFYKNTSDEADDDFLGQIDFEGNDSGANRTVFGRMSSKSTDVSDGSEDGNIIFYTMKAGTLTETLTLQSGNVNINTGDLAIGNSKGDSITTNTEVAIYGGEGGDAILQLLADNADNTADYFAMRQLASGNFTMGHHTGGGFNDALVIDPYASGNNVGIGESSPAKPLHIKSDDNQPLRVESTDAYSGIELKDNGSSTLPPLISALSDDFIFYGGHSSSRPSILTLTSSSQLATFAGNVSIINSSASNTKLLIENNHASANALLQIDSSNNRDSVIQLLENGTTKWDIRNDGDDSDKLKISDDGDVRLTIDQSGNSTFDGDITIAKSSGAGTLDIKGASGEVGRLRLTADAGANATDVAYIVKKDGGNLYLGNSLTATTEHLSIDTSGNTTFGGSVQVPAGSFVFSSGSLTIQSGSSSNLILDAGAGADEFTLSDSKLGITVPVGIGIDTPVTELHIKGSGEILRIENDTNASGNTFMSFYDTSALKGYLGFTGGSSDHYVLYNNENADMRFFTNATHHMTLDPSGNLGIGTDSPSQLLHIKNSGVGHAHVNIESTDNTYVSFLQLSTNGNDWQIASGGSNHSTFANSFYIYDTTNSRSTFRLDANSRISLSNNDSGSGNTVFGYLAGQSIDAGSDNNVFIGERVADASLNDATNNIGLGYFALSSLVNGDNNVVIGSSAGINITGTSSTVLIGKQAGEDINNADALGTVAIGHQSLKDLTSGVGNTAVGYLSLDAEDDGDRNTAIGYQALTNQTGTSGIVGNTALGYGAGDLITTGVQNVLLGSTTDPSANNGSNQVVIGYNATGQGDDTVTLGNSSVTDIYMAEDSGATVHCAGIQFPASQSASADANTLDDYEEGSHSPTITGSTSGSMGMNTSFDELAYTKIGRVCTLTGLLYITSDSSISGNIQISLPFACAQENDSSDLAYGACQLGGTGTAINGTPVIRAQGGNSFVTIFVTPNDGGDATQLTHAEVDGTWFLGFTITYITA